MRTGMGRHACSCIARFVLRWGKGCQYAVDGFLHMLKGGVREVRHDAKRA